MVTWDSQTAEMVLHPRGIDGIDHRPWAIVMTRRELRLGEEIRHDLADPAIDDEQKKKLREFLAEPENQIYNRNLRMLLQEAWKAELEATNPLDHIYALLNLASDREELGIEVDYTLSPVELYRKAVRAIYTKGDLALLAYCKWDGVQTDLPSWVPHFTGQQGWIPIRELCGRGWHGTSVFDASKGKQAVIAFGECNPKILKINGIAVDTLTFLDVRRADVSVNDVTPANRRHIVHWLRQTFDYLSDIECEAYPNAKARKEAVWKTPILNHFNRGYLGQGDNHAGPEAEKGYNALLRDDMETQEPALVRLADIYFSHMMRASNRTRPFRTSKGYIGLGSTRAEEGDIVVVLLGCEVPFLLRKWGEYHYRLIGEVYVHGIMFGELFAHEPQIDTFHLC
ncbi:uncharacterized protein CC84DRAFT_610766 [Paraphaeosphaeria sporulosa]|uniref:Heterokaryon incompatibility domain-containing protein n=1 Tax=Paraphaeosphaeria sporulosa TaxID=1460663 RepID=A0A177CHI4_9PLEO|nr:uncharacterized protein CC84DRAFT_610766 [Paraphaeosphaeria sporulosa]OAG06671.1 hypothetical protein CC84DRAFT_610766 [Paraphaeosphaeria sporulosa]